MNDKEIKKAVIKEVFEKIDKHFRIHFALDENEWRELKKDIELSD